METTDLFEAGVKTAKLDIQARKAIHSVMNTVMDQLEEIAKQSPDMPDLDDDTNDNRWGDFYQISVDYFDANKEMVSTKICATISKSLTDLTQNHLAEIFPDGFPKKHMARKKPKDFVIRLEARELSDDKYKSYGGYAGWDGVAKVFIDIDKLILAADYLLQERINGEAEDGGADMICRIIIPTYLHEYAHLEQAIRGSNPNRDHGYITGQDGKKFGLFREPRKSQIDYLQYHGSSHEIDSFASGAASQIVQTIRDEYDFNLALDSVRSGLGDVGVVDYQRYLHIMHDALHGYYDEHGLRKGEMGPVWKRFQRLVYQKLEDYRHPDAGRADAYDRKNLNPEWVALAKTCSRKDMIWQLASLVGIALLKDRGNYNSGEDILRKVLASDTYSVPLFGDACEFIGKYYYGDAYGDEAKQARTLAAFKGLVAKKIEARIEREKMLADA